MGGVYFGPSGYGYALNCHFVNLAIPETRPLFISKQNVNVLFICNRKSEIHICSSKHKIGLVHLG